MLKYSPTLLTICFIFTTRSFVHRICFKTNVTLCNLKQHYISFHLHSEQFVNKSRLIARITWFFPNLSPEPIILKVPALKAVALFYFERSLADEIASMFVFRQSIEMLSDKFL